MIDIHQHVTADLAGQLGAVMLRGQRNRLQETVLVLFEGWPEGQKW